MKWGMKKKVVKYEKGLDEVWWPEDDYYGYYYDEEYESLDKAWDSGLKETRRCGFKQHAQPTIFLSTKVRQKIERLLEEVGTEWLAYLEGRQEGDSFFVTDLYLPEQRVSGVSVEVVERSPEKAFLGVVHSHGELCAEFSDIDEDFINANNMLSILIGAKGEEIRAQARYALPCGYFYRREAVVRTEQRLDDEKFAEEIERKIKPIRSFYSERHRETGSAHTFSERREKYTVPKAMSQLPTRTPWHSASEKPRVEGFVAKMADKRQNKVAIVAGSSNSDLAKEIAKQQDVPLRDAGLDHFPDGEISVHIKDTVRGADVFVIQSTSPPVNENLMELLLMIDALKRASAGRITAVIPYYGYACQDRVCQSGEPLSAKLVANLIQTAGASGLVAIDLHSRQIQGFFDILVYHLEAAPLFAQHFEDLKGVEDAVIVSPDAGGLKRARAVAEFLGLPIACIEKHRSAAGKPAALDLFGDVEDKRAIVIDDILSTGHTLIEAAKLLHSRGAEEVHAAVTHGLFVGEAIRDLERAPLESLVITDTVTPKVSRVGRTKVEIISVSRLLADEIMRIHEGG